MSKVSPLDGRVYSSFVDLTSRFFLNLPASELETFERIFYQLEQAHWYYEDVMREEDPALETYTLREFCINFFQVCPILKPHFYNFEELFAKFQEYLHSVPVCGAIILNSDMTKVLLVQGYYGKSWGFPKGKINQDETPEACAIREVLEETGLDISNMLNPDDFFTAHHKEIKLYVIRGAPEDRNYEPTTQKEIGDIRWFSLTDIPTLKKAGAKSATPSKAKTKFWSVGMFIPSLKKWIKSQLSKGSTTSDSIDVSPQRQKVSKPKKSPEKKQKRYSITETFGVEADSGWSVEDMFATNETLFSLPSTNLKNPNDLASSLAMAGTGYRCYIDSQKGEHPRRSSSFCEFKFDEELIMKALISSLEV